MKLNNTKRNAGTAFFIGLLLGATGPALADTTEENTNLIESLNPDQTQWNQLLSVALAPTAQPVLEAGRVTNRDKVVMCKNTNVTAGDGVWIQEGAILNPSGTVAWPGALLIGDRNLAQGTPTPLILPRGPLTIIVGLPGLAADEGTIEIPNPTNVSVKNAINRAVDSWVTNHGDWTPPLTAFGQSQKSYSQSQVGVDLGFGAQWTSGSVSASMKMQSNSETTVTMQAFKQIYYSVEIEESGTPGSFFADTYQLRTPQDVSEEQPPVYVRSVDYGRLIVAQMQVDKALTEVEAEAAMKYASTVTVEGHVDTKIRQAAESAQFRAIAIGGGARGDEASQLFSGDMKAFQKMISAGFVFSKANPAQPIAYKFASVADRVLRGISPTTTYVKHECEEFPNRSVEVRSTGGFVSKFAVSWDEPSGEGGAVEHKSWESGDKTSPYQSGRLAIPGDATNIKVIGQEYTGLVWDPVRTPLSLTDSDLTEQHSCFNLTGTTLSPSYEKC